MSSLRPQGSQLRSFKSTPKTAAAKPAPRRPQQTEARRAFGFPGSEEEFRSFAQMSGLAEDMQAADDSHGACESKMQEAEESLAAMKQCHSEGDYDSASKHLAKAMESLGDAGGHLENLKGA